MNESVSNLQAAAGRIFSWTKTWGLVLNEKKTTLVHFTTRRNVTEQPIYINNVKITPAHVVKYLGMTMDSKLTWGAHIDTKIKELRLKSLSLHSIFAPNSSVSQYNKVLIYNQIIKPVWMYIIPLGGCTANQMKIQRYQTKCYARWSMRRGLLEIQTYIVILVYHWLKTR